MFSKTLFVLCCYLNVALLLATTTPRFVSYIDKIQTWWPDSYILEAWGVPGYSSSYAYNVLNFAFYQSSGTASDALQPWVDPTKYFSRETIDNISHQSNASDDQFRSSLKALYKESNILVLASCFGASDYPTNSMDPTLLGNQISGFIKKYQFDGVDIDWEDSNAFDPGSNGKGEYWLSNLTVALRNNLNANNNNNYIITHAPQAPYFMGKKEYPFGAYLYIDKNVGNLINWYNVQFYNQGSSDYTTYQTLFVESNGWSSNTSVYQMIQGNNDMNIKIPSDRIVIGKPVTQGDAENTGYVSYNNLESIMQQAINNNNIKWNAGIMDWQFSSDENQQFNFINNVVKPWK